LNGAPAVRRHAFWLDAVLKAALLGILLFAVAGSLVSAAVTAALLWPRQRTS
jgi:hypothetical protein